ncbi:borealin-like isoform X2 [Battus philenor]|uniref:borealin-like isoform X2 n=1 Tax=Battus philenor TaxID=42288 RepID=UPI0035D0D0C9
MPRTKRPVKKSEKAAEVDDVMKKLEKLVADNKKKLDSRAQMEMRNVELAFKILLGSISKTHLQKTVGQLKAELHFKEVSNTTSKTTPKSSISALHDDGPPPSTGGRSTRRSRSADASRMRTASKPQRQRRSQSVYRTPAYNKNAVYNYPVITPKVTPHTPLTVLRQPRQGEMVLSMSGSPVMVPSCYAMQPDEKANCNILLQDGTMLSLQPKQLRKSQAYIPFSLMDSNVLHQLKTLKDNLDKVVELGEKAIGN